MHRWYYKVQATQARTSRENISGERRSSRAETTEKGKMKRIHKTSANETTHENGNRRSIISKARLSNHTFHKVEPDAKPQDTDYQYSSPRRQHTYISNPNQRLKIAKHTLCIHFRDFGESSSQHLHVQLFLCNWGVTSRLEYLSAKAVDLRDSPRFHPSRLRL